MFCLCQSQQTGSGGLNWTLVCKRPKSTDRKWWAKKKMFVRFFLWFQRENSGVTFKTRLLSFCSVFSCSTVTSQNALSSAPCITIQSQLCGHRSRYALDLSSSDVASMMSICQNTYSKHGFLPLWFFFFFFDNVWLSIFKINVEWQTQLPTFSFFMRFDGI